MQMRVEDVPSEPSRRQAGLPAPPVHEQWHACGHKHGIAIAPPNEAGETVKSRIREGGEVLPLSRRPSAMLSWTSPHSLFPISWSHPGTPDSLLRLEGEGPGPRPLQLPR